MTEPHFAEYGAPSGDVMGQEQEGARVSRNRVMESEPADPESGDLWIIDTSGTCDWGDCDEEATCRRYNANHGWLPVCNEHALAPRGARG